MIEPVIDSGREAEPLKTDKQYQYSCLLPAFSVDVTDPIFFLFVYLSPQTWSETPMGGTL